MSFVEFYNEQLFDLFLSPEKRASRNRRRFNVFGGNGSNSSVIGKRNASLPSALKPTKEVPGSGGNPSQQAPELAIYERPDGCTYVKVSRASKLNSWGSVSQCHVVINCKFTLQMRMVWGCFASGDDHLLPLFTPVCVRWQR